MRRLGHREPRPDHLDHGTLHVLERHGHVRARQGAHPAFREGGQRLAGSLLGVMGSVGRPSLSSPMRATTGVLTITGTCTVTWTPGGDLPEALLAPRHQDDVDAARRHLPRELLADARRGPGDERPGAVRVLIDLLHGIIFWTEQYNRTLTEDWTSQYSSDEAAFLQVVTLSTSQRCSCAKGLRRPVRVSANSGETSVGGWAQWTEA